MDAPAEIRALRQINLRKLANQLGGMSLLARHLNKTPAQISHLIGINARKNIGNRLANTIEQALGLPPGWLDIPHPDTDDYYDDSSLTISSVPLLTDSEVLAWIQKPIRSRLRYDVIFIKTHLQLTKHAFAFQVQNDLMEAPHGISFPVNSIVIAEPERPLKNNDYVVIQVDNSPILQISQLVQEGSHKYLKPQNPLYPITELITHKYIICGILRQAIIML